jgi:hypothetical protein
VANQLSGSTIVKYALISAVNLAILLVGIALGVMLAPHMEKKASADDAKQGTVTPQKPATAAPSDTVTAIKTTPVQPGLTTGTIGVYLLLSHQIQSDQLVVNGYDILKLQDAELKLLSRFVSPAEIQKVISDSKAQELFRLQEPSPAK